MACRDTLYEVIWYVISGDASFPSSDFVDRFVGETDAQGLSTPPTLVAGSTTGPVVVEANSGFGTAVFNFFRSGQRR